MPCLWCNVIVSQNAMCLYHRLHQRQLLQQTQRVSQNPARPMQLDVEHQHPRHAQQTGLKDRLATPEAGMSRKQIGVCVTAVLLNPIKQAISFCQSICTCCSVLFLFFVNSTKAIGMKASDLFLFSLLYSYISSTRICLFCSFCVCVFVYLSSAEPALKVNTWVTGDHSYSIAPCGPAPASCGETLYLEDVQTDEDKLSFSQLSSDTGLLHLPVTMPSTKKELDKADALAPESTGAETGQGYPYTEHEKELVLGDCSDCTVVEVSLQQAQRCEAAEAALKIQAWWRGYWTRRHHLQAREVRAEIRLRRMQEHITFLSAELEW